MEVELQVAKMAKSSPYKSTSEGNGSGAPQCRYPSRVLHHGCP